MYLLTRNTKIITSMCAFLFPSFQQEPFKQSSLVKTMWPRLPLPHLTPQSSSKATSLGKKKSLTMLFFFSESNKLLGCENEKFQVPLNRRIHEQHGFHQNNHLHCLEEWLSTGRVSRPTFLFSFFFLPFLPKTKSLAHFQACPVNTLFKRLN